MDPKDRLMLIFVEVMKMVNQDVLKAVSSREDDVKKAFINSLNSVAEKDRIEKEFKRYNKKDSTDFPFNVGC